MQFHALQCIVTCFSSAQENEVLRLGIAAKSRVPKMRITFSEVPNYLGAKRSVRRKKIAPMISFSFVTALTGC